VATTQEIGRLRTKGDSREICVGHWRGKPRGCIERWEAEEWPCCPPVTCEGLYLPTLSCP